MVTLRTSTEALTAQDQGTTTKAAIPRCNEARAAGQGVKNLTRRYAAFATMGFAFALATAGMAWIISNHDPEPPPAGTG